MTKLFLKSIVLKKKISGLSQIQFKDKTNKLIKKLSDGKSLNEILLEAYALVRESSKRIFNERHFDVQIIGELC